MSWACESEEEEGGRRAEEGEERTSFRRGEEVDGGSVDAVCAEGETKALAWDGVWQAEAKDEWPVPGVRGVMGDSAVEGEGSSCLMRAFSCCSC